MMQKAEGVPARASKFSGWASLLPSHNTFTLTTYELNAYKEDGRSQHLKVIPSLDGIRAISVLIVVLGHSGFDAFVPGGLGVTIFFFLSGYLITTLLLAEHVRTGRINIFNFYIRRVLRLMPPLLISLVIAYSLTYTKLLSGGITGTGLTAQLLYFANYYGLFFDRGNTVPDGQVFFGPWQLRSISTSSTRFC